IDAARGMFDAGRREEAISRLELFAPKNELVDEALASLREQLAEIERQAEREASIARGLRAAGEAFERGKYEAAIQSADEVLFIDGRNEPALDLRRRARAALDEQRRLEELEQHARNAIDDARRMFGAGERQHALDLLSSFQPHHDRVLAVLTELRQQAE